MKCFPSRALLVSATQSLFRVPRYAMIAVNLIVGSAGKMALRVDATFKDLSPGLPSHHHVEVITLDVPFYVAMIKAFLVIISLASNHVTVPE